LNDKIKKIDMNFDDNQLLPLLYGEHNGFLKHIEQELLVSLVTRGHLISVEGQGVAVARARTALNTLWERLKQGLPVSMAEVDAALRMTSDSMGVKAREVALASITQPNSQASTSYNKITPRSTGQAHYLDIMNDKEMVFAVGPAGTGKTYLAVAEAVGMLKSGRVDRIIISRPAVEAGENLGFLPGDLKEKIDPYLRPIYDALYELLPDDQVSKKMETGAIEIAPLAFMRGRTLKDAFIIVDEAQNTTPMQMKMLLTRMGENSRMVITGDVTQIDLPRGMQSGLLEAIEVLKHIKDIGFIELTAEDVVRHALVGKIVGAYDKDYKERHGCSERKGVALERVGQQ